MLILSIGSKSNTTECWYTATQSEVGLLIKFNVYCKLWSVSTHQLQVPSKVPTSSTTDRLVKTSWDKSQPHTVAGTCRAHVGLQVSWCGGKNLNNVGMFQVYNNHFQCIIEMKQQEYNHSEYVPTNLASVYAFRIFYHGIGQATTTLSTPTPMAQCRLGS